MEKHKQNVTITNRLGLHARAALQLVQLSQQHRANIELHHPPRSANADSVLDLLMLEAQQGDTLTVSCDGEEAEQALAQVCQLIHAGFHE